MATIIDTTTVTVEQMDRVERVWDDNRKEWFCIVQSESDDLIEYHVRYNKQTRRFTCTCPAGQEGFAHVHNPSGYCKHVRWSVAYCEHLRKEQREQAAIESYVRQGVDRATAVRIVYAEPFVPTREEMLQAEQLQANRNKGFRLMR